MKHKIKVNAPLHIYIDMSFFEGNVKDVAEKINNFIPEHKEFIKKLEDNSDSNIDKFDPNWNLIDTYEFEFDRNFDGYHDVVVNFFRHETDEEVKMRFEKEQKKKLSAKAAAEKRKREEEKKERELYETLKKKYEGN